MTCRVYQPHQVGSQLPACNAHAHLAFAPSIHQLRQGQALIGCRQRLQGVHNSGCRHRHVLPFHFQLAAAVVTPAAAHGWCLCKVPAGSGTQSMEMPSLILRNTLYWPTGTNILEDMLNGCHSHGHESRVYMQGAQMVAYVHAPAVPF